MEIKNGFDGKTVKEILKLKGFSTKTITALKKIENGITLNNKQVTVRAVFHDGDMLFINDISEENMLNEHLVPSSVLPDIVYEDDALVLVNKPNGMPTHQSIKHFDDSLANSLCYYYNLKQRPFVFRAVNRLDRNTSGLVLVAKTKYSASILSKEMQVGEIKKSYIAILEGNGLEEEGKIETYIRRKEESIIFREVSEKRADAQYALTEYKVLKYFDGGAVVLAEPKTGRTHQLRVHFAHIGHHIFGDDLYGNSSDLIGRHALHAVKLSFVHPLTKENLTYKTSLPDDMVSLLESKGIDKNGIEEIIKKI